MLVDHDEIAVAKLVGSRMAEARALCKLPLHIASDRLGISAKSLEQIENGIDVERIPLKLIRMASSIYDVSVDFLFGYSDDWETDPTTRQDREFGVYIHREQIQLFSRWAVTQLQIERQVEVMKSLATVLPAEIEAVDEALTAFKQMNPDFDRLPAGSMLQYRISRACEKAQEARRVLIRHKVQVCN